MLHNFPFKDTSPSDVNTYEVIIDLMKRNEQLLGIGKAVLVFQTHLEQILGKLLFRWTEPF